MSGIGAIARQIRQIGFSCQRCGNCCQGKDSRVMVYPQELQVLEAYTGLPREAIAEPYPGFFDLPAGGSCTFEWALQQRDDRCVFLTRDRCRAYPHRSWICRTFPFWLEGDRVLCDNSCPGIGKMISDEEAVLLARDLVHRREVEQEEERRIGALAGILQCLQGRHVLIDSEGVWDLAQ